MKTERRDPGVQTLLDEAHMLPDCAARDTLLGQVAKSAEALGDLDTAWEARTAILSSMSSCESPRFETLFLCLAWCLAMSDRDPERFSPATVLWQYKWVATQAPRYASVPRRVLTRLVEDMDERFIAAGWGRRAGVHKRLELHSLTGDLASAMAMVPEWRATPRDRGSDCTACEADTLVGLHVEAREDETALREAKQIIRGRLTCATVPHSTFGVLLSALTRLGRHDEAKKLYQRGRRLATTTEEAACALLAPYLAYGAFAGEIDDTLATLRIRLPQAVSLRSDYERADWFGWAFAALTFLERHGVQTIELMRVPAIAEAGEAPINQVATACREIALRHAGALDARNGNTHYTDWLNGVCNQYIA
ncbi:MAG: hypothetical protein KDA33_16825 [Phycisphaerales bacterium]|nr:hypothetical protein [Phycisphaerales bacterium]